MDAMYCKKRKKSVLNSILSFHDDILVMIFTRLSITTILQCRRVCKSFYIILSSRYFAESYQSNPPFTSLIIHYRKFFSLLELKSGYNYSLRSSKPKILPDLGGSSYSRRGSRFLVGSCNGFVCYFEKHVLYISNPFSGSRFRVPEKVLDGVFERCYGFGFCRQTQRYTVLELVRYVHPSPRTEVHVFTVGIDKFWRRVHCPFQQIEDRHDKEYRIIQFWEVNGKGALHWILNDTNRLDYLYSFDISEEKVRPIPPPVGLKWRNLSTRLVFMHGCLCLLHMNNNDEQRVEFWCMTDYMVQDSWTLRIISQTSFPLFLNNSKFHSVAAWKNEEILMIHQGKYIVSCNLEEKNFNKLDFTGNLLSTDQAAVCFVPNFFSYLEAGTTEAEMKDDTRKLGLLLKKLSKRTEFGNRCASIMNLPIFLLENIFSRVPVDMILCCKGVCKIWGRFLSNPRFAKTYHKFNRAVHLILCDGASLRFLFELKSDSDHNVKASRLLPAESSNRAKITVLGSSNGLVCLSVFVDHPDPAHQICICNPVVRQLAILPKPEEVKRIRDEAYGFGFGSMTGHYKVLRIMTRKWRPGKFEAYVLTIGIDKNWRQVRGNCAFRMPKKCPRNINKARFCDVPFNNAIHWIGEGDSKLVIYAFDIDDEQFKSFPAPPCTYSYSCLGILRDCLCVLHPQLPNVVELWSLKTYGSVTSWTREIISISLGSIVSRVVLPITSWRDEEILMWVEDGGGTLISYCSKENKCTEIKMKIGANNEALIAVPYVQSFLSLKDAIQNGHLNVNKMVIETGLQD